MYDYLMILYQVVDESTVCLMGHERRQTLALIEDLRQAGLHDKGFEPSPPPPPTPNKFTRENT